MVFALASLSTSIKFDLFLSLPNLIVYSSFLKNNKYLVGPLTFFPFLVAVEVAFVVVASLFPITILWIFSTFSPSSSFSSISTVYASFSTFFFSNASLSNAFKSRVVFLQLLTSSLVPI